MKFAFLFVALLVGCGRPLIDNPLVLTIHLPASLSRTQPRRAIFLERVTYLEVSLSQKGKTLGVWRFPPSQWDQILVSRVDFEKGPRDSLSIQVKVWDRDRKGIARRYPALAGKTVIKSTEMAEQGSTSIPIRLSLKLPVAEYDR